jgi:hypothetical protein
MPVPKNRAAEPVLVTVFCEARTMLTGLLRESALAVAFLVLLSIRAAAGEIPYAVAVDSDEQIKGVVSVDDSSGEVTSAKGAASGAVTGTFALDAMSADAELHSAAAKLDVRLDRKSQQLRARLDTCPVGLDSCSPGNWVTLWEQ